MKRTERVSVRVGGETSHLDVDVLICNRCGAKVLAAKATERAWVAVESDGRGGNHVHFCGPAHAIEYFRELMPREVSERPQLTVIPGGHSESVDPASAG